MGVLTAANTMFNNTNSLFNGNIVFTTSYMNTGNASFNQKIMGNLYQYDQLNRIRQANTYKYDAANGYYRCEPKDKTPFMYDNAYTYDLNGNLLTLQRYNGNAQRFDNLTYNYDNSRRPTNRLTHVNDDAANTNIMNEDIDNQAAGNYAYDALGNMIKDQQAGITAIDWTPFGKIDRISAIKNKTLGFKYDALGNRVEKFTDINGNMEKLYYLRDAQGNIMSTYKLKNGDLYLDELYVYGSSRLGILLVNKKIEELGGGLGNHTAGKKTYELNNHLGNVMMTISDAPKYLDSDGNSSTDATTASVSSAQDYYPFGMLMPGRNYSSNTYKFGFNGKEMDNEVDGMGNQYDYGMRIYNPRVARFLSVDPLFESYPWYTPYQFAGNKPIQFIDLDGMEEAHNNCEENKMNKYYNDYGELGFMHKYYDDFVNWISKTDSKTKVNDIATVVVPVNFINWTNKIQSGQKPTLNEAALAIVDCISFGTFVYSIETSLAKTSTKKIVEKSGTYTTKKAETSSVQIVTNKYPWDAIPTEGKSLGNVAVKDNKIFLNNKLANVRDADFVFDLQGNLKLGKKHQFLANNKDVQLAGRIKIVNGNVRRIDNLTGHYETNYSELLNASKVFKNSGIDNSGAALQYYEESSITGGTMKLMKTEYVK